MERNFGQAHPEGYRKALRLMKQAEKFHRPVLCFVDTSGAYPGIGAEERGQGQAIAENLMEMMTLKTPVLTIVVGEGGSGGALALAVADEVWMMEILFIPQFLRRVVRLSFGKTVPKLRRPQRHSNLLRRIYLTCM